MRRLSAFLLLLSVFLVAGCDGVAIDLGNQPREPRVTPETDLEPQPDNIEVLVFTAKWCSACQRDKPQIETMRRRGVKVTEIDADEHPELLRKYGVRELPTYIVLEDGIEVERTGNILLVLRILSIILRIAIPIVIPPLFG